MLANASEVDVAIHARRRLRREREPDAVGPESASCSVPTLACSRRVLSCARAPVGTTSCGHRAATSVCRPGSLQSAIRAESRGHGATPPSRETRRPRSCSSGAGLTPRKEARPYAPQACHRLGRDPGRDRAAGQAVGEERRVRRSGGSRPAGRRAWPSSWRSSAGGCAHVPTWAQLEAMARLGGVTPKQLPARPGRELAARVAAADFPHGTSGLCFAHAGGAIVVLPGGAGFALA